MHVCFLRRQIIVNITSMYTQHSVIFSAPSANIFCHTVLSHEVQNPTQFSENILLIRSTPQAKTKAQGGVRSVSLISESNIRTSQVVYYPKRQLQYLGSQLD